MDLDSDRLLTSAARYLVDGGEEDAARVLLACSMNLDFRRQMVGRRRGCRRSPRRAHRATRCARGTEPRTKLDASLDELGVPHEVLEKELRGSSVTIPTDAELAPIVRPAIEWAIGAVLPAGFYIKHLTQHVELVDIDPEWRNERLSIARERASRIGASSSRNRPPSSPG